MLSTNTKNFEDTTEKINEIRYRIDNIMAKRKETKRQTIIDIILHRK